MGRPRNRRRAPKRRARQRPLPVLRGSLRRQIDTTRVRMPLVRQQDRRCRFAQTRYVQQAPFHGHGGGIHSRTGPSLPYFRTAGACERPCARAPAPRSLRRARRGQGHRGADDPHVRAHGACRPAHDGIVSREDTGQRVSRVLRGARLGVAEDLFRRHSAHGLARTMGFLGDSPVRPRYAGRRLPRHSRRRSAEEERRHRQVDVFACGKRCREGVRIQQEEHAPMGPQRA